MNLNTITANISVHLTCSNEIRFDLILNNNLFTCLFFYIQCLLYFEYVFETIV